MLRGGLMSQFPAVSNGPDVRGTLSPVPSWATGVVGAAQRSAHHLHLSAFHCDRCNGPVILGWLGTLENEIAEETDIRKIGAVCLACGCRPNAERTAEHRFRPVEWEWVIKEQGQWAD